MGKRQRNKVVSRSSVINRRRKNKKKVKVRTMGPLETHTSSMGIKWNSKSTMNANFKRLGILSDVNDLQSVQRHEKTKLIGSDILEQLHAESNIDNEDTGLLTDTLKSIQEAPSVDPRLQTTMAIWEQLELKKLVMQYGWEDYESMSKDISLNTLQRTPNQLRKRLNIYKRLLDI